MKIGNMCNTDLLFGKNQNQVTETGLTVKKIHTFLFYFHFGGKEYSLKFNIVRGRNPLIISHKNLDDMGVNYQTLHKNWTESKTDNPRR